MRPMGGKLSFWRKQKFQQSRARNEWQKRPVEFICFFVGFNTILGENITIYLFVLNIFVFVRFNISGGNI